MHHWPYTAAPAQRGEDAQPLGQASTLINRKHAVDKSQSLFSSVRRRHHGRRRGSTRRIVGLVRTDDPRLELHSGSAPGRPSCGGPGAAPNRWHPPSSKPRGRGPDSALPGFNGVLMLDACRACKGSLTASPRSACCGERAMLSMKTVQDRWFSGICLDGVRQRPCRALLTTRFLTFNSSLTTTLSVDAQDVGAGPDG